MLQLWRKLVNALSLHQKGGHLKTFSTVTHFTHCNLCTGTLLYMYSRTGGLGANQSYQRVLFLGLSFSLFPSFSKFLGSCECHKLSTGPNSGTYDIKKELNTQAVESV